MSPALLIIGHGSTLNPDSSAPTLAHSDDIRRRGHFSEVCCAFWKEEPSMREVYYMLESDTVFIVPNFISEGYFTREVVPRELELNGPVTRRHGKTIYYCDPVGIHPSMTRLLLNRANEVAPGVPRHHTSLIIVGHGTGMNEQSRKAIESQVALIRQGEHGFAEVLDAYMEEAPFVAKWDQIAHAPHVVIVPFFIADGLHSFQEIPVLLGLDAAPAAASQSEVFRQNPHEIRGRQLYYSSAIGTEALMAEVILDQVSDFCRKHHLTFPQPPQGNAPPATSVLPGSEFLIGQVLATPQSDGSWRLQHAGDTGKEDLKAVEYSPAAARSLTLYDDAGEFRPLKTAPNLRHGWVLQVASANELKDALDWIYPGALEFYDHWQRKTLRPVHLRETLGRQTGMYRFANTISDAQAQHLIACTCDARTKCLRRITWRLSSEQSLTELTPEKLPPTQTTTSEIPLLCVEACTHVVSAARELARTNQPS